MKQENDNETSQLKRALAALKEMRSRLEAIEQARKEPIAIIGMSCRFPGGADDPDRYWQLLYNGVYTINEIPADRWDIQAFYDQDRNEPGKMATRRGSFLDRVDEFDPFFFGISPREVANMDPQQRLLLELSWEALENAGLPPDKIAGSQTGVFLGLSPGDYLRLVFADPRRVDAYSGTGNNNGAAAGRLSYQLGLHGPSFTIDTACSSSLVALHLARQSLLARECDMALVASANLVLAPGLHIAFSKANMLSSGGLCKTFDEGADGYVRGEGGGMIIIKRLSTALADGDNILALIRGSAVNQDGRSNGLTAPNGLAQEACVRTALSNSGIRPEQVSYVEAHGTGTSLGDPIEVMGLSAVFSEDRSPDNPLLIGSVKTNIGHLEPASGLAGLIKVILSMQHQELPPHLHLKTPNPHIPWDGLSFKIPTEPTSWPAGNEPRIAGISSYGFGGTNAHVILEEPPSLPVETASVEPERPLHLLTLSARNEEALMALADRYGQYMTTHPDVSLADIGFTASTGRTHFTHRLALVAETTEQAQNKLAAFFAGQWLPGVVSGVAETTEPPAVAFLFTGQGSQYAGMGRQLYETQPVFRNALDQCDELLRPYLEQPLLSVIYPEADTPALLDETAYTQPALFSLEYALAELWRSWGIEPAAVMGHSVGEYVAACLAGVFTLEDGLKLIAERGRLMQALPKDGTMASVQASEADVLAILAPYAASVSIAAINGPQSIVLSGERGAIEALLEQFKAKGVKSKALVVSHAFHSPLMEPILDRFEQFARQITFNAPRLPLISNVTGRMIEVDEIPGPTYWREHIREAVRFADAMVTLHEYNYKLFLEVGPSPTLLAMGRRCIPEEAGVWLPSLRQGRDDWQQLLTSLGTLYTHGAAVDGDGFDRGYSRQRVMLPTYPFQRQRYWYRDDIGYDERNVTTVGLVEGKEQNPILHPMLGRRLRSILKDIQFENQISYQRLPFLFDHQLYGTVVVPGAAFMEMGLAAAAATFGSDGYRLENVTIQEPLILQDEGARTVQLVLTPQDSDQTSFQLASFIGEDKWRTHTTGTIRVGPDHQSAMLDEIGLETIQGRCQKEIDVAVFYDKLREIGLDYGPHFQGVNQLWRGDNEALAQVRLPESIIAEAGEYQLHPALLDACFHPGLLLCTLPSLGSTEPASDVEANIYIPFGFDRFAVYRRSPSQVWSHVTTPALEGDAGGREVYKADLRFYDDEGQLVAEVAGMYLKKAPRAALRRAMQPNFDNWMYEIDWQLQTRAEPVVSQPDQPGDWLIFADQNGVGPALAERLQAQGERCVLVHTGDALAAIDGHSPALSEWSINPAQSTDFGQLLQDALPAEGQAWRGLVYLWSADPAPLPEADVTSLETIQRDNCGSVLYLVQALAKTNGAKPPHLWLATRGSQAIENGEVVMPAGAPVWGLGQTIALEHPGLHCVRIDLSTGSTHDNAQLLFEEIWSPDGEDQIAYRGGSRYVARLVRSVDKATPKLQLPTEPYDLVITERGVLDNLTLKPLARRAPGPGEIEIRVRASGLNFRDVLKGLGMYPGDAGHFGDECAGVVVAVGEGVEHLQVGDEVFGMAPGCFRKFVTTSADFMVRKPKQISFEEAATIPVTFLTAYYALHHLGQMTAGERVLVHAAAGGVGVAAVQLAQRADVEVFGTAGSPDKHAFLRSVGVKHLMNSRTLDFSDEILAATDGQGVDLVLNSLNGDFIPKSLAAMTDNGRFLEIGKVGIWDANQVAELKPEASYHIIFLDEVRQQQPALVRSMLEDIVAALEDGTLKPLPRRLFPIQEASDAFRYMAQAKHIGKVVLTQPAETDPGADTALFKANASYLITGGLGGLGLTIAQWMAEQGARQLVLVGRSQPSEMAQAVLSELTQQDVNVTVARGDISQAADVSRILDEINQSLPPLRGIIHAAGVLDDGILQEQDWGRFARVMGPKVDGSWHLHTLTRQTPLDFFVLFSSITSVLGSAGQGNYVAANAFMDTLAFYRRSQGLPAVSISWGPWAEVGMIAALEDRTQRRWSKQGMDLIIPEQGVQALERVLRQSSVHLAVLPMDWAAFFSSMAGGQPPLLTEMARYLEKTRKTQLQKQVKPAAAQEAGLLQKLAETAPDKRRSLVVDYIREQARVVFGLAPDFAIDPRQSFNELGLDSLMAVELRNALSNSFKAMMPATLLFDYPTINAVADYLLQNVLALEEAPAAQPEPAQAEPDVPVEAVSELEELSDEEAEALLMDELLNLKKEGS